MIYFDNAATSWPKPRGVAAAMVDQLENAGGNPGRAGHHLSLAAAAIVTDAREAVARLFHVADPSRVVFTHNATHALNLALHGLLRKGDHVVTTSIEHNSVMRPLRYLERSGVELTIVACRRDGSLDVEAVARALRSSTRLLVATHASNVSGTLLPVGELATLARSRGVLFLVDASQTAGAIPIDVTAMGVDLLAFTGHKALLGPTGTGGLYVRDGGNELRRVGWVFIAVFVANPWLWRSTTAQTSAPQTHWEPYKNRNVAPSVDQKLTDPALIGAIDLHVHHDPDSYPRQWDAFEVARLAQERGLRGIVLKNHWTETAGLAQLVRKYATPGFEVFGSVTLDTPTGGVNPQAVRYMLDVAGNRGRIVWMPTHDSDHEVRFNKETRPSVSVTRGGTLRPEVLEVIRLVAGRDLALATGHVTPDEALQILREAKRAGVKRLIVTHPLLAPQYTYMSIDQLRTAVDLGGYIEITAGSLTGDDASKNRVMSAIRTVGARRFFVGSDSGLVGTPNLVDALAAAAKSLRAAGINDGDLTLMFKDNPAFLVNLPPLSAPGSPQR